LSHGKLILVDGTVAVIGSISLSALSLGFRRELAITVHDENCVKSLNEFFRQSLAAGSTDEEAS
jgi:phosphatidylserine/phosphatidylglycerophosphate/cardiolipin synthase-like enzyme